MFESEVCVLLQRKAYISKMKRWDINAIPFYFNPFEDSNSF